jgi:D-alanyl-D-alanine carboxypeptidase
MAAPTTPNLQRRPSKPRLAEPNDADALAGLWRHAMSSRSGGEFSLAQLTRSAQRGIDQWLAPALQSGCVLGIRYRREWVALVLFDLETAEMRGPFVAPDWQGQGLGRRLVAAAERRAAEFQLLRLAVNAFLPALPFYRACGYEPLEGTQAEQLPGAGLPVITVRRRFPRRQGRYGRRIATLNRELGLPPDYGRRRALPLQPECPDLVSAGQDAFDRPQQMTAGTLEAWERMRKAAADEDIALDLVSAFRSVDHQAAIIRRKREAGQNIAAILAVSAAPGFSEHHSGRALDLTTPGCPPLERPFEATDAFRWLEARAASFGFRLSYPEGNHHGIAYEPWHWYFQGP